MSKRIAVITVFLLGIVVGILGSPMVFKEEYKTLRSYYFGPSIPEINYKPARGFGPYQGYWSGELEGSYPNRSSELYINLQSGHNSIRIEIPDEHGSYVYEGRITKFHYEKDTFSMRVKLGREYHPHSKKWYEVDASDNGLKVTGKTIRPNHQKATIVLGYFHTPDIEEIKRQKMEFVMHRYN